MRDVILKSGREVKLKPLNVLQRAEIQDLSNAYLSRNPELKGTNSGVSMVALVKSVQYAVGDVENWTTEELIECGLQVWEDAFFTETDKKK